MDGIIRTYVLEGDGSCLCHTCYGPNAHRDGCHNAPTPEPRTVEAAGSAGLDIILDGQEYEVVQALPIWDTDDTRLTLRTEAGRRRYVTLPDERPLALAEETP